MFRSFCLGFFCIFCFYSVEIIADSNVINSKNFMSSIGELTFFDLESKELIVTIYKPSDLPIPILNLIKKNTVLSIYQNKRNYYADFQIKSILGKDTDKKLLLKGILINQKKKVYVGLKVRLHKDNLLQFKKNVVLPDSRLSTKEIDLSNNKRTSSNMIYIPSGRFVFGSNQPDTLHYTSPVSQKDSFNNYLFLPGFYIDKYEVTHEQFNEFLNYFFASPPPEFNVHVEKDLPVDNVNYMQAKKYCEYKKKRLPTELEWEKAARGMLEEIGYTNEELKIYAKISPIQNQYPFGEEFDSTRCNTKERGTSLSSVFLELGDVSSFGVIGMCGNVREWTSSWLQPYRGNNFKNKYQGKRYKVIKGGSYKTSQIEATTYARHIAGISSRRNDFAAGIRCAKDVDIY